MKDKTSPFCDAFPHNNQFKPTHLRGTCFVRCSTKASPAPSVGLTARYAKVNEDRKSRMKLLRMIPLVFLLNGCEDDSFSPSETAIWNETSQRIVIVQDNGNVPNSENRFITYDYSLDTLPAEAKEVLPQIKTKTSELTCVSDGVAYEVTITDESGLESDYLSNNKACNNVDSVFVDTSDIEELTSWLSVN